MIPMSLLLISSIWLLGAWGANAGNQMPGFLTKPETLFISEQGRVRFTSDAPLELIEAESGQLRGLIDTEARTFAFTIDMLSFQGFNSPLQREHFNEIYMETEKFPKSSFAGKIIEEVDFEMPGTYSIRAKGKLTVHGVEQERIIRCDLVVAEGSIDVDTQFSILLREHDIRIPRVFHQKIAEEIQVRARATFAPKSGR